MATGSQPGRSWTALWRCAEALRAGARALRHLSQEEPLLGARPDYPRARIGRPHAKELRTVLDRLLLDLEEAGRLIPEVFPDDAVLGPLAADEAPRHAAERLTALARIGERLKEDAFRLLPPLAKHAPPYLAEAPRPLAGSIALQLSYGLDEAAGALENALLAALNAPPRS